MARNTRRSERGAALAEFGLAFPVLILVMLAVIDFGVEYGNKVNVADSARRTSRVASVGRSGNEGGCYINGTPPDTASEQLVCLAKRRSHMDPDRVAVKLIYMGPTGKATTDFSPARMTENKFSVVMCVSATAESTSGILNAVFDGRFHHSRSVTKTGKPAGGTLAAPFEETPLTNGSAVDDWSWCTADDPAGTE